MKNHKDITHRILTYVDDTQHVISATNNKDLKEYIQDLHDLLVVMYRNNSLAINSDKTEFLCMEKDDGENQADFTILDDKRDILKQKNNMKILGYTINRDNNLETHMSVCMAKMNRTFNNLRNVLPRMTVKNRRIILNAKIGGQLRLTLPLTLNQNQRVKKRAITMLMKVNKWIHGGNTFMQNKKKICDKIGSPMPEKELIDSSVLFIHKLISQTKAKALHKFIYLPNRTVSRIYHRCPKKKLYRTPLESHLHLYNQIPAHLKFLNHKQLKRKLKKETIDYTPEN